MTTLDVPDTDLNATIAGEEGEPTIVLYKEGSEP